MKGVMDSESHSGNALLIRPIQPRPEEWRREFYSVRALSNASIDQRDQEDYCDAVEVAPVAHHHRIVPGALKGLVMF